MTTTPHPAGGAVEAETSRFRDRWESRLPTILPKPLLIELVRTTTWRRHPAPFSKTHRGAARRTERLFIRSFDDPAARALPLTEKEA